MLIFALPLFVALLLAFIVTTIHRFLPPVLSARVVAASELVVVVAAVPTVLMVGLVYLAHLPALGKGFEWCAKALGFHQQVPIWLGLPAIALTMLAGFRVRRVIRSFRELRFDGVGTVEVVDGDEPFAVTLPGRGGQIVLSRGLIDMLDDREQQVVVAHERTHARCRHDRYLLLAQTCSATLPLLRPLSSRLQFSLERWADESAVAVCGDRHLVARTLAKVALRSSPQPTAAMGFLGLGVTARVAALLAPPPAAPQRSLVTAVWLSIGVTGLLGLIQIHHLTGLISALCPG